jgi:pyrroloquinoline quinone biosynthesis protein D
MIKKVSKEITAESIPEIAPTFRFQWEEAQNCFVVLYPEGMVKLSGSAGEIMKRVNGESSIGDMITELEAQFAGAELTDDVHKFFEVAQENGWIRIK